MKSVDRIMRAVAAFATVLGKLERLKAERRSLRAAGQPSNTPGESDREFERWEAAWYRGDGNRVCHPEKWADLNDKVDPCEVDEVHIVQALRADTVLHTIGEVFEYEGQTYEICHLEDIDMEDGLWWLIYAHPRENVNPMTEEEWNELYGDS